MNKATIASAVLAALAVSPMALADNEGYAETIYRDFAVASGGAISFDVQTIETGRLGALAGLRFSQLTGAPEYVVIADMAGTALENIDIVPTAQIKTLHLEDLEAPLDGFEKSGFPLEQGAFRLLQVTLQAGDERHQHVAVEACWASSGHCVVYDPSVEFIDSLVHNIRNLKAEGWQVEFSEEPAAWTLLPEGSDQMKTGTCGLASRPWATSRSAFFPAYIFRIRNAFNNVVLEKSIGRAESGVRCDVNCNPQPFGYANASSAWAKGLRSVACDNAAIGGVEGSAGRFVGRTGCSHRTVLGAKFKAEAKGFGLQVDVSIDVTGSSHTNGQAFQDACARF
ncbi:MAG: hypothetical protein MEQ07_04535 [Aquimonas sp.]|nr:hypothetical protein [Aquimonas sp.]